MPQMAPISWLTLFIIFFLTFILFNIMNYFSYFPHSPMHQNKMFYTKSMSWKW